MELNEYFFSWIVFLLQNILRIEYKLFQLNDNPHNQLYNMFQNN